MKKVIAFLVILVLSFSFAACSTAKKTETAPPKETQVTKEQMIENAKPLTVGEIYDNVNNNVARAKSEYQGGMFLIWGQIKAIGADYCDFSIYRYSQVLTLRVYMPADELIKTNKGEAIQIVGTITDITEEEYTASGYTFKLPVVIIENAHYVTNEYKIVNASFSQMVYNRSQYNYTATIIDDVLGPISVELSEKQISISQWNKWQQLKISATGTITDQKLSSSDITIID